MHPRETLSFMSPVASRNRRRSASRGKFKIRGPCFHNRSGLPEVSEGEYVADLIATLDSLDIVLGSVDR